MICFFLRILSISIHLTHDNHVRNLINLKVYFYFYCKLLNIWIYEVLLYMHVDVTSS